MVRTKRIPFRIPKQSRVTKSDLGDRKPHRWKPGTRALREIKKMQARTDLLIPRAPFYRVVRSIAEDYRSDIRFASKALRALHEESEAYLVEFIAKAYNLALLEKKVTIMPRHIQALKMLEGEK